MPRKAAKLTRWAARWGFATLVVCGAIAAAWVAWRVDVPAEVPSFALQAVPIYRLEVGAAVFAGAYLASMAVILALNNRAFSEIGMAGIKAHDPVSLQGRTMRRQQRSVIELIQAFEELDSDYPDDEEDG